ncbi:MAG: hypothetical protein KDK70_03715 [Myxococcales bacterium]|nr:hypothetical protein [Myxococcales bacterium]
MGRENVDVDNLQITGVKPSEGPDAPLTVRDEVIIVVNQAYGPRGDQLVGISEVAFDGFPALTLRVRALGRDELVHLSPIHGDRRKQGMEGLPDGTKCEVLCPVSGEPLPRLGRIGDSEAEYCAIYLTPKLDEGSMIFVSDTWGHHHSRIVDNHEMISLWVAAETGAAP